LPTGVADISGVTGGAPGIELDLLPSVALPEAGLLGINAPSPRPSLVFIPLLVSAATGSPTSGR
jgi:hypothetical protein